MRNGRIRRRILGSLLGLAALGGGWLFWSDRAWEPCEALGAVFAPGRCVLFARLEGRSVESLLQTQAGDILVVSRQSGTEPTEPLRIELRARATGAPLWSREIPDLPPASSVMGAALSPDETRLALGLHQQPATVVDLASGAVFARAQLYDVAYLGFEGEERLLASRMFPSPRFSAEQPTRRFALEAGALAPLASAEIVPTAQAARIFQSALDGALSPDGERLFFALPTDRAAGLLRVGETSALRPDPEHPHTILQAQIPPGCGYLLPKLLFSDEQEILAAAYDCPRLGEPHAGLAVWNLRDGRILANPPTAYGSWSDLLALRGEKALLARRHDAESRSSEIRRLSWGP